MQALKVAIPEPRTGRGVTLGSGHNCQRALLLFEKLLRAAWQVGLDHAIGARAGQRAGQAEDGYELHGHQKNFRIASAIFS